MKYLATLIALALPLISFADAGSQKSDLNHQYELTYSLAGQSAYHHLVFLGNSAVDLSSHLTFSNHLRDDTTKERQACDSRLAITLAEIQRRAKEHIIIWSGFRSETKNKKEDGATLSQHLNCTAVDFQLVHHTAEQTAVIAVGVLNDLWGDHLGGIGINNGTIHLDTGPRRFWRKHKG